MELLPDLLRVELPPIGSQQNADPEDRKVFARYFISAITYTWFVTEGEETASDFRFFGYVINEDGESWTEFSLSELQEANQKANELVGLLDMDGLNIERDSEFEPVKFKEAYSRYMGEF
jgi:hypothetical protein